MAVDTSRLRFGDMIAGASAVLLFLFMFFKWFKITGEGSDQIPDQLKDDFSWNAWEGMPFLSIILLICIAVVIGIVVVRLLGVQLPPLPVPLGTIILAAAGLALLIILFRLLLTPDQEVLGQSVKDSDEDVGIGRSYGIFLGLLAALGMLAGGFLSARERGEAIPGVDGPIGGGGAGSGGGPLGTGHQAGGPLGTGQPAGGQPVGGQPVGGQPVGGQPGGAAQPAAGAAAGGAAAGGGGGGNPPPDWYDDPRGEARLRYWDGQQWTDQTAQ
jgi:hypothetical protein